MSKPRALPRELDQPHPDRLNESNPLFVEIMFKHNMSVALDQPGYSDPATGYFVFNAKTWSADTARSNVKGPGKR